MSLYRQPGRHGTRALVLSVVAAFAAGALLAFPLGRSSAPEPSLGDQVARVRADLQPARQGLEILPEEYAQSVQAGGAASPAELAGVTASLARVRETVRRRGADLRIISPAAAAALERDVAAVEAAVSERAAPERVTRLIETARADLAVFLDER